MCGGSCRRRVWGKGVGCRPHGALRARVVARVRGAGPYGGARGAPDRARAGLDLGGLSGRERKSIWKRVVGHASCDAFGRGSATRDLIGERWLEPPSRRGGSKQMFPWGFGSGKPERTRHEWKRRVGIARPVC